MATCFAVGIVPLLALGVVIEKYRPGPLGDVYGMLPGVGLVGSIGLLALGCLLVSRRRTRDAVDRIRRDNLGLSRMLDASISMVRAELADEVAATAADAAFSTTRARAAFVLLRTRREGPLRIVGSAGPDSGELFDGLRDPLLELANLVIRSERPAIHDRGSAGARSATSAISAAAMFPIPSGTEPLGVLAAIHTDRDASFGSAQLDSLATLASLASRGLRYANLRDTQQNLFSHVTELLTKALDSHLNYHAGHGPRVARYSNLVAREMQLKDDQRHRLHFAALLHDIGMLDIDPSVHHTSKICRRHPVFGFRRLDAIRVWEGVAPAVLHHHEWFDGSGYPAGLAGVAIPLESRIVAVCEAFDSMTASTSYKVALPLEEAVREIEVGAGTQFDPEIARAFVDVVHRSVDDGSIADWPVSGSERGADT